MTVMEVQVKIEAQNLKHNCWAFGGRAPRKESYLLKGFQLVWYTDTQPEFRMLTIACEMYSWFLDTETREGNSKKWLTTFLSIYKCYFRCFVVSPFFRLQCSVLRMKGNEKMHCSLYFSVISFQFLVYFSKNGKQA